MTLDVATPYVTHTVAGIGPYAASWPYVAGAMRVSVRGTDGMPVALATPADWSVSPSSSTTAGNVTLTLAAAATHAGKTLILERLTSDQQGWIGNRSALDKGIENQLDAIVMSQQELRAASRRAMRSTVELPPFTPGPAGSTLIFNGTGFVPGPQVDEIAAAQAAALEATAAAAYAAAVTMLFQGLAGDGATDDTAKLIEHQNWPWLQYLKTGNYLAPGVMVSLARPRVLVADHAKMNGNDIPYVSISDIATKALPKTHFFVSQVASERSDSTTVFLQRNADADTGLSNPKALRSKTNVTVNTASNEWAISGEVDNYSNGAGNSVGTSGISNKYGTANVFGGHFQAKDWLKVAAPTNVTSIVGVEINTPAIGLDHPTANDGTGLRRGLDVIARTNDQEPTWNVATGNYGNAEIGVGVSIRADSGTQGWFRYGLLIKDGAGNPNPIGVGARIENAGAHGLQIAGVNTTAQIQLTGNAAAGIILSGTYISGNALRINAGQYIAMEGTGAIRIGHGIIAGILGFYNGASERIAFNMGGTPNLRVNGVKVLGAQIAGWGAPTGTATRTTYATGSVTLSQLAERVKALIDDLTTHGMIGA